MEPLRDDLGKVGGIHRERRRRGQSRNQYYRRPLCIQGRRDRRHVHGLSSGPFRDFRGRGRNSEATLDAAAARTRNHPCETASEVSPQRQTLLARRPTEGGKRAAGLPGPAASERGGRNKSRRGHPQPQHSNRIRGRQSGREFSGFPQQGRNEMPAEFRRQDGRQRSLLFLRRPHGHPAGICDRLYHRR